MTQGQKILAGLRWVAVLFLVASAADSVITRVDPWDRVAILLGYASMLLGLWWLPGALVAFAASAAMAVGAEYYAVFLLAAPMLIVLSASIGSIPFTSTCLTLTVLTSIAANIDGRSVPELPWLLLPLTLVAAAVGAGIWTLCARQRRVESALHAAAEVHELALRAQRRDLATTLHDGLGGALANAALIAANEEGHEDPRVAQAFKDIRLACAAAARQLSQVVALLRDEATDERQLPTVPSQLAEELSETLRTCGWSVDLTWERSLDFYPVALRRLVERFLVEAVTNVLKHARHSSATRITSHRTGTSFSVQVTNDLKTAPLESEGLGGTGLRALREAAEDLDASVTWSATDSQWTLTLAGDLDVILGEGYSPAEPR